MAAKVLFVNKSTGKEYVVLAIDKSQNPPMLTLQGQHAKFEQVFDKELLQRMGYELVKREEEDAEQS